MKFVMHPFLPTTKAEEYAKALLSSTDVIAIDTAAAAAAAVVGVDDVDVDEEGYLQHLEDNCIQTLARQFQFQFQQQEDIIEEDGSILEVLLASGAEQQEQHVDADDTSSSCSIRSNATSNGKKRPASLVTVVSPERPSKVARQSSPSFSISSLSSNSFTAAASTSTSSSSSSVARACLLPTADDPMDETFVMSLDSIRDNGRINPVHIIVRRHVFEVRRTVNTGRVFFQCACCKHRPRCERAKLSTLAPQGVRSVYRAFVRFMMQHVSECTDIPMEIKNLDAKSKKVPNYGGGGGGGGGAARNSRMRTAVGGSGIKDYWEMSARRMGLMDGSDGKSIVFHHQEISDDEANF